MARLAALLCLLCACALPQAQLAHPDPDPAPQPALPEAAVPPRVPALGTSREPSPAELALIRELMQETEQLRGLAFRAPVRVRIQDRSAMRAYVDSALDQNELAKARRRYVALGLLDPSLDVRELISSLMEEELVGYYDPREKVLAIREDVAGALSRAKGGGTRGDLEWRATVVHELVHALQDQHLGLSETMEERRTTDEENVFGAVVEGDATLAMLGYAAQRRGSSLEALVADPLGLRRSLYSSPLQAGGRLASAPAIVRDPLLFRYREGAIFAARVYARSGWEGVNRIHRRRPPSTLALVDGAHEAAPAASSGELPDALSRAVAPTCSIADRDVLGSLEIASALSVLGLRRDEVARSWRGDAYAVLACGDADASFWLLRFSVPGLARRVRSALLRADAGGSSLRAITQEGTALMVARGIDPGLLPALGPVFRAWVSARQ